MSEKIKNHFKLKDVCRTANLWYVGSFMLEYIKRKEEWNDEEKKSGFIEYMFKEYPGIDSDITGTRARANAMIRIIENRKVEDALQLVLDANNKKIGCPESKEYAQKVLDMLSKGDLQY